VTFLVFLVVMLALVWLLFVRPARRRQVEQAALLESVSVGDEILTAGGLYARVESVDEDELTVEIAPGTSVRLAKRAVAAVLPPEDVVESEESGQAGRDESTGPAPS
jgi:preprotein translocase subunit YajC